MSKAQYLKKLSAVFMLMLFFGLSVLSFESALLCFGKDGHVAIEFVDACSGSDFGSQIASAESDACGPCRDVQFQGSLAYTNRTFHSTATQTLPIVSSAPITPSLSLNDHHNSPINLPEKPFYKTLASLQSVVLLI